LVLEFVVFAIVSDNFLTPFNLQNTLRDATDLAIVSIGMTMVIMLGGVDLSVGSAMGVVAIIVGWLLQDNWHPILIGIIAILAGTVIGFINGILISWLRIPDIIATLGTSNIWRAAVFGMLGGQWLTGLPDIYSVLTSEQILGIPVSVFVLLVFYAGFWYLLVHTPFGRRLYAVGNSPEAATLAGVNAKRIRIMAYSILGSLVGFASLLYIGRLASVEITVGVALPINAIAAVIIGGTAVTGGRGSIIGTLAGVFFMAIMRNGIVLLGIPSLWERAVVGALIILSVTADVIYEIRVERRRREEKAARRGKKKEPRDAETTPSLASGG
jgi:ribose transport system permease protein/AI-2 transport system permease protein